MTSIFRDQKFAPNWFRRSSPGTIDIIGISSDQVLEANPVPPGANAPNGTYIIDQGFGVSASYFFLLGQRSKTLSQDCAFYDNLAADNVPGVLLNTTGLLKDNVNFLLNAIHNLFPDCPPAIPNGAANV